MNIKNLFKKKYVFEKPREESGAFARPKWAVYVAVFLLVLFCACIVSYFVFDNVTKDKEGTYVITTTNVKKIDSEKSNSVLDFFKSREDKTNTLKTTPSVFIDPSV